jgi:S-methylmethionine transporter
MTMVAVNFAFSGTELIGIAAGETENPHKVIPVAIRTTIARLIIFFIGTVFVLAALIPMQQAGVEKSPFVLVFEKVGIPYAADIFNFVILTAISRRPTPACTLPGGCSGRCRTRRRCRPALPKSINGACR